MCRSHTGKGTDHDHHHEHTCSCPRCRNVYRHGRICSGRRILRRRWISNHTVSRRSADDGQHRFADASPHADPFDRRSRRLLSGCQSGSVRLGDSDSHRRRTPAGHSAGVLHGFVLRIEEKSSGDHLSRSLIGRPGPGHATLRVLTRSSRTAATCSARNRPARSNRPERQSWMSSACSDMARCIAAGLDS